MMVDWVIGGGGKRAVAPGYLALPLLVGGWGTWGNDILGYIEK